MSKKKQEWKCCLGCQSSYSLVLFQCFCCALCIQINKDFFFFTELTDFNFGNYCLNVLLWLLCFFFPHTKKQFSCQMILCSKDDLADPLLSCQVHMRQHQHILTQGLCFVFFRSQPWLRCVPTAKLSSNTRALVHTQTAPPTRAASELRTSY